MAEVFTAIDGCNKCLCTEQGMQCTARACSPNGFGKFTKKDLVISIKRIREVHKMDLVSLQKKTGLASSQKRNW